MPKWWGGFLSLTNTQKSAVAQKKGEEKNIALGRPRYKRLNAGKYIQENFLPPYDLFKCKHGHRASKHTSRDERLKIRAYFEEEPISQGVQKNGVWEFKCRREYFSEISLRKCMRWAAVFVGRSGVGLLWSK